MEVKMPAVENCSLSINVSKICLKLILCKGNSNVNDKPQMTDKK